MDRKQIRDTNSRLKKEQEQLLSELRRMHLLISLPRLQVFIAGAVLSALASRSL